MRQGTVVNTFSGPAKFDETVIQHSLTIEDADGQTRYINIRVGDEKEFEDVSKVVANLRGKTVEYQPGNGNKAFLRFPEKPAAGVTGLQNTFQATPAPQEEEIPF